MSAGGLPQQFAGGGEEFVTVLADCPVSEAIELAERIRKRVHAYRDGEVGSVTLSVGAAQFSPAGSRLGQCIDSDVQQCSQSCNTTQIPVIA